MTDRGEWERIFGPRPQRAPGRWYRCPFCGDDHNVATVPDNCKAGEPMQMLAAPRIISDGQGGINGLMSMTNGQHYDSKSEMRKEYKRAGVIEVGNDVQTKPTYVPRPSDPKQKEARRAAIGRTFSRLGWGAP